MEKQITRNHEPPPRRLVLVGENDHDPLKIKNNRKIKYNDIYIATINCRSLGTTEKLQELELALDEIKWDIIGISEVRRLGERIEDHGKYILYHIGETPGLYGVGFIVKRSLAENIQELRGISERIALLNIQLPVDGEEAQIWSIIQAYSPTESNKREDITKIEKFYEDLRSTVANAYKNVIVMGDFNGQIGKQRNGEEYTIGNHGYGSRSNNGSRLVSFGIENKLSILNSFYKKKTSKKWTWISPNGRYKNEIDYIMSNNVKVFKDLSVLNNFNFNTDHKMVRAKLSGTRAKRARQFHNNLKAIECTGNTDLLLNNLKTSLQRKENENISTQEKYTRLLKQLKSETKKVNVASKTAISSISKQLLQERKELIQQGKNNNNNAPKIAELSKKISEQLRKERKAKRLATLRKYIEKTGGIKKAIKEMNDKKDWILNMRNRNRGKTSKRPEILQIATEYYQNLYQSRHGEQVIKDYSTVNKEEIKPILKDETILSIQTQKLDKAPGSDLVTNELLKTTSPVIAQRLTDLFNEILETETIPEDWTKTTIILLHKKGDKDDIGNYRPISLMSNIYKVFSKIILKRITNTLDENQPKEQAGFRSKFSTIDHIHTLRQILQKYREYNKTYYIGFVDFNKAFDTLEHEYIWDALRRQGIQEKYIQTIKNVYTASTAQVKLESMGNEFPIRRGVRQGDPISPKLFSAVLEMIFRNLDWTDKGLNINGENLSHLRFADDLILFSEDARTLEIMLQQLCDESAKAGLTMNLTKTKIMTNAQQTGTNDLISVNNENIEYVKEYIYLGQLISTDDCMKKEIERRITNTWKRYWSLKEVMKDKDMPMKGKKKVYELCIMPCLLYGCQTWALTELLENKLKVCQNSIERSILGIKRRDRVKLEKIKNKTKFKNAQTTYRQLKWRWTGHMLRESKDKWTKIVTEWYPRDNKRSKGRQVKRWEDDIKKTAGPVWTRLAKDRNTWKSLEEAFVDRQAVPLKHSVADNLNES